MWHSWLWLLRDQSSVIISNFWANFNPIRKPGRHLPDIISYQPNEDWWLAKDTNWCCHWEKRFKWELIRPPQPQGCLWPHRHSQTGQMPSPAHPRAGRQATGDALNEEKLISKCIKTWHNKIIIMVSVSDEPNVLNVKKSWFTHQKYDGLLEENTERELNNSHLSYYFDTDLGRINGQSNSQSPTLGQLIHGMIWVPQSAHYTQNNYPE